VLILRRQQIAAFEADIRRRLKERVLAELRVAPPAGAALPDEAALRALLDRCERQIDRYDGYFSRDARRYLFLALELGEEFAGEDWARAVFEDPEIPGPSKLDVLEVHAAARSSGGR
jgi:hypothetical protein